MRREKGVNAGPKGRIADQIVALLEHAWRLVVDDRAVVALRLIEIAEPLPERCRARGEVDVIGGRLVAEIERHPWIREMLEILQLRRHVRREALLEPEVVE